MCDSFVSEMRDASDLRHVHYVYFSLPLSKRCCSFPYIVLFVWNVGRLHNMHLDLSIFLIVLSSIHLHHMVIHHNIYGCWKLRMFKRARLYVKTNCCFSSSRVQNVVYWKIIIWITRYHYHKTWILSPHKLLSKFQDFLTAEVIWRYSLL